MLPPPYKEVYGNSEQTICLQYCTLNINMRRTAVVRYSPLLRPVYLYRTLHTKDTRACLEATTADDARGNGKEAATIQHHREGIRGRTTKNQHFRRRATIVNDSRDSCCRQKSPRRSCFCRRRAAPNAGQCKQWSEILSIIFGFVNQSLVSILSSWAVPALQQQHDERSSFG